jgi:hypothetical protein
LGQEVYRQKYKTLISGNLADDVKTGSSLTHNLLPLKIGEERSAQSFVKAFKSIIFHGQAQTDRDKETRRDETMTAHVGTWQATTIGSLS